MPLTKFADGQAFVFCDLGDAPASGPLRVAPKVLQSTSKELARSMTYRFALFSIERGGLAAGLNWADDNGVMAAQRFGEEVADQVGAGHWRFFVSSGGGDLPEPLTGGIDHHAEAAGIVAATTAALGRDDLDGVRIVVDRLDAVSPDLLDALGAAGAHLVAVGTKQGTLRADRLDPATLRSVLGGGDVAELGTIDDTPIIGVDADALLVGAKMGAIDHTNADDVVAKLVVPLGLLPFTTKAAVMLQRRQVMVLPDFLSLAGGSLVPDGTATDAATAAAQVTEVTRSVVADRAQLPSVSAALAAESFLATWTEPVFGRPFAP